MADEPEPTPEQVKASVKDAIRKLTGSEDNVPKDGVPAESGDDTASPRPPSPKREAK